MRAFFRYLEQPNFPPRYNVAPTQPIPVVRLWEGARHFALVRWGLIPGWVKDPRGFSLVINARGDSVLDKPAFRAAMLVPASFVFFLVMGLVMLGIATPTEAAATGVFGALILSWFYGRLTKSTLCDSLYSGVTISSVLLLIMCCSLMYSQLLTFAGAPQFFAEMVRAIELPVMLTILLMLALPFVLHILFFLDQVALFFILVPIYKPILAGFGVDEIWFFTMFLLVATVGGISPPFGYTLFAMKSALPGSSMSELYKAAWPYVWIICLSIVLIALFPVIATWLPSHMGPS